MNPFDTAWDFFKAAGRVTTADPSGSKGAHWFKEMGQVKPMTRAVGFGPTGSGEGPKSRSKDYRQTKTYFDEPHATAPDPDPDEDEAPPDFDPALDEGDKGIYQDLPEGQFPQTSMRVTPPPRGIGNPRGYFQNSEPFDAAWALLKEWEDTDWTGVPQIDSEGGMTRQPAPVTEDPWAGVDWSDWAAQMHREGTTDHEDLGPYELAGLARAGDMDAMRALARQGYPEWEGKVDREMQRRALLRAHNSPYYQRGHRKMKDAYARLMAPHDETVWDHTMTG
jgi:hypothetical protein